MDGKYRRFAVLGLCGVLLSLLTLFSTALQAAPNFANAKFQELWEYSDKPVSDGLAKDRGYTWGPNSIAVVEETYQEAPGGKRLVQYFDKSRMELATNGVTNGLLTKELVSGQRQDGDNKFISLAPSILPVAGDLSDNPTAPSYKSFGGVISTRPGENSAPNRTGQFASLTISVDGKVMTLASPPAQLSLGYYEPVLGHNVPAVFSSYENLTGLVWDSNSFVNGKIYTANPTANVFGLPVSEPYWVKTKVGGTLKDVLVQLFERRVLTYTPSNPDPFKVEMGNIGQHYYEWRYNTNPPATSTPNPTRTPVVPVIPQVGCLPGISTQEELVQACVDNPTPDPNTQVTVYSRLIIGGRAISGTSMNSIWHFQNSSGNCGGTADSNGVASCSLNIGNAKSGYKVVINVEMTLEGLTYNTTTSLTPR